MAYQSSLVFNAKTIFLENQKLYHLIHTWGNKGFIILPIKLHLVNVIASSAFQLTYYDIPAQLVYHFVTDTPSPIK